MGIETGLAESGEMFAASEDVAVTQAAQKFARVDDGLFWFRRNRTRGQHVLRWLELQIEDGGEVGVESKGTDFFADQPAMLAEELLRAAAATSATDGIGATTSRRRSTVPPSMSTQRNIGAELVFCASRSNACVCPASSRLRLKRMIPPG